MTVVARPMLVTRHVLDLRAIATPINDCICLSVGEVDAAKLALLREGPFDQAPVRDGRGKPVGVIPTAIAERLLESGTELEADLPELVRERLPSQCSLDELFACLGRYTGVLVADDGAIGWLVTRSDLNRHRLRSVLYSTLAELESLLAKLIDVEYPDSTWLGLLPSHRRDEIDRLWKRAKRRRVDVGAQAGANITDLMLVIAKSEQLRESLGYRSPAAFEEDATALANHRNRVMHPVKLLVARPEDLGELADRLARLEALIDQTRLVLGARGMGTRVRWL